MLTSKHRRVNKFAHYALLLSALFVASSVNTWAVETPRHIPLTLNSDDVLPTGNEWIALPEIRASDGALMSFNVLSMRQRGLLEVTGERGIPVLQPYFTVNGKPLQFKNPSWELIEYWIPTAHLIVDGLDATVTYCAPPGSRAAYPQIIVYPNR